MFEIINKKKIYFYKLQSMNALIKDKYDDFKEILSGCNTLTDANFFAKHYIQYNPEMNNIIRSTINGKQFENTPDMLTVVKLIKSVAKCKYREEAMEIINSNVTEENKIIYDVLTRLICNKPMKYMKDYQSQKVIWDDEKIIKKCPYCKLSHQGTENTSVVVCGIDSDLNKDSRGCGKEWCFLCNKKIIKKEKDIGDILSDTFEGCKCEL